MKGRWCCRSPCREGCGREQSALSFHRSMNDLAIGNEWPCFCPWKMMILPLKNDDLGRPAGAYQDWVGVRKNDEFCIKTRNSVSKTRNFVFQMMHFAGLRHGVLKRLPVGRWILTWVKIMNFVLQTRNSVYQKRGILYQKRWICI